MSKFFINRPNVAMVIGIVHVFAGVVSGSEKAPPVAVQPFFTPSPVNAPAAPSRVQSGEHSLA